MHEIAPALIIALVMPSVCLYFQIHQPVRLRRYSVFDTASQYFDNTLNAQIVQKVAARCYIPALTRLLDNVRAHAGRFKFAVSITGTAVEQFEQHAPQVMHLLHALAATRCVEFLGETYYHSLACVYSHQEFKEQVDLHRQMLKRLFGITPRTFRNTELIYSNDIAHLAAGLKYDVILTEGWAPALSNRPSSFVFQPPLDHIRVLLRNHILSDALAFHFGDVNYPEHPLTPEKFARMCASIGGQVCNLFMDFETFGEHYAADTGILDFLADLPAKTLAAHADFRTPAECADHLGLAGELDVPHAISWADQARDLSAWLGNAMQANALQELFKLERVVKAKHDPVLLGDWRRLTTSDHAYYMSTKHLADGAVHDYFSPYESPYDAYINFMNVLDHLKSRATR